MEDYEISDTWDNEEEALVSPDDVTVKLSCEVGQVTLSLEEISNLKVGDSIDFIKWPGKVKLKLNGLMVAEGYLVEVNGMLGVKITNKAPNLAAAIN